MSGVRAAMAVTCPSIRRLPFRFQVEKAHGQNVEDAGREPDSAVTSQRGCRSSRNVPHEHRELFAPTDAPYPSRMRSTVPRPIRLSLKPVALIAEPELRSRHTAEASELAPREIEPSLAYVRRRGAVTLPQLDSAGGRK
jgi:hypothetical protein